MHSLDLLLCAPARKSNIIPEILDLAFEDHESVIEGFDLGGEGGERRELGLDVRDIVGRGGEGGEEGVETEG